MMQRDTAREAMKELPGLCTRSRFNLIMCGWVGAGGMCRILLFPRAVENRFLVGMEMEVNGGSRKYTCTGKHKLYGPTPWYMWGFRGGMVSRHHTVCGMQIARGAIHLVQ